MNLIGEHTDYNGGLSLAFAIQEGVTVAATRQPGSRVGGDSPFVEATAAELRACGRSVPGAHVEIASTLSPGEGLSSSAAVAVAIALALSALAGEQPADRIELARLCRRAESASTGVHTGLLDQIASLCGRPGHALRIDFSSLAIEPVPLELEGWRLGVVPSGHSRSLADSGYRERRAECARAAAMLGLESLRDASPSSFDRLPEPLGRRVRHVAGENARVDAAVEALKGGDLAGLGRLLDASHASLRDLYDASTEAVERTVERLHDCGAAGARMMGGGFGGSVLALFAPDAELPESVRAVAPGPGARLLEAG